ncbi:hypothetical protein [Oryza sativa Japonica Group]|uniref:Uncharacterized protein n=1 Tax=Oryza sativa subsp. japonica TaxID=39947 RepID=Q5ZB72_ORYSJ|nr:hypothetical protein [Oryza sativa Japonica Group]
MLALDWAELRRARLATSGCYGARAATAASTRRATATVGAAPASYGEATRATTEN